MQVELRQYLQALAKKARLDSREREQIVLELEAHVSERAEELTRQGLGPNEAVDEAVRQLGQPEALAEKLYSVHSKGSWGDVLLGTLPHLMLAGFFALHLWTRYVWVVAVVVLATVVALRAWRRGKPKWSYPWLGYAVGAAAISWLLTLVSLGYGAWMFFTTGALPYSFLIFVLLVAYLPISLWTVVSVAMKVVRQDWLLVSLTALPFPFLTTWVLFLNWQGGLWAPSDEFQGSDIGRALVFVALAITTAVYYKVGHRGLKVGLLMAATVVLVVSSTVLPPIGLNTIAGILIAVASVAFLLSPALIESRLSRKEGWYRPLDATREVITSWFSSAESR